MLTCNAALYQCQRFGETKVKTITEPPHIIRELVPCLRTLVNYALGFTGAAFAVHAPPFAVTALCLDRRHHGGRQERIVQIGRSAEVTRRFGLGGVQVVNPKFRVGIVVQKRGHLRAVAQLLEHFVPNAVGLVYEQDVAFACLRILRRFVRDKLNSRPVMKLERFIRAVVSFDHRLKRGGYVCRVRYGAAFEVRRVLPHHGYNRRLITHPWVFGRDYEKGLEHRIGLS